jgi:hypothetical protein
LRACFWVDAFGMELRVDHVRSGPTAMELSPDLSEANEILAAAECAGSMTGREGGCFVEEEELREPAGLEQPRALPAAKLKPAGDPALAVVPPADVPAFIVEAATVAVDEPAAWLCHQLTEGCDPVLQRHAGKCRSRSCVPLICPAVDPSGVKGRGDMTRSIGLLGAATLCAALLVCLPGLAGAGTNTTACNGVLEQGVYKKVIVPAGAVCLSDGPVTIRGGLFIERGATFVLGNEEAPGDNGTISGGVHATNAASVQIHFMTINGGVDVHGGSGPVGGPFDITWNAIEDNQINGGATVEGYNGFWFGFIRNHVNGSVKLNNNVLPDPDANEYVTNTIHGSLQCAGNSPAPQIGDSMGEINQVTGAKQGQCRNL